jgi:hypothetical protein
LIGEELHNLYSLPNIIRMINSRRARCIWHAARMKEKRLMLEGVWWESQE